MTGLLFGVGLQLLAVSVQLLSVAEAVCPPADPNDGSVTTYIAINETQYDRTYASITSGRHPLGFYSATWIYNSARPNPCIEITASDASLRLLEIKVETVPEARICVSVSGQDATSQCYLGRGTRCGETPGNTIYVEFLCDSQCGESDVTFWYRLVLSPLPSERYLETWCFDRPDKYPQDLASLPPGMTLPPNTTPRPGGDTGTAAGTAPGAFLLAALLAARWVS